MGPHEELFAYTVQEIDCSTAVAGTENFTVGADTPFVAAIVGGVVAGIVGAAIVEIIT